MAVRSEFPGHELALVLHNAGVRTGAYTGVTPGVSMAPGIGVSPGFGMTPGVGVSTGRGIPAGPGSVP